MIIFFALFLLRTLPLYKKIRRKKNCVKMKMFLESILGSILPNYCLKGQTSFIRQIRIWHMRTLLESILLESILPNFVFLCFLIFVVKLEFLKHKKNIACIKLPSLIAKMEKIFILQRKKFGSIDSRRVVLSQILICLYKKCQSFKAIVPVMANL